MMSAAATHFKLCGGVVAYFARGCVDAVLCHICGSQCKSPYVPREMLSCSILSGHNAKSTTSSSHPDSFCRGVVWVDRPTHSYT